MKKLLLLTLTVAMAISLFSIAAPTASATDDKPKHHHSSLNHNIFGWLHFHWPKVTNADKINYRSF